MIFESVLPRVGFKPSALSGRPLLGAFGMVEMELATGRVAEVLAGRGDRWDLPVSLGDFREGPELSGFLQLLCHGWMVSLTVKDQFYFGEAALERLGRYAK